MRTALLCRVVLVLCLSACGRSPEVKSACDGVDCDGQGTCELTVRGTPLCLCAPGFRNVGALRCVDEDTPVGCASAAECDDGNPCTDDVCDVDRICVSTNNAAACDDGSFCTVGDTCSAGACGGAPRDCGGVTTACAIGTCSEASDACVAQPVPNGVFCDSGDACVQGVCAAGACVLGPALNGGPCDSGDPCFTGVCSAGVCTAGQVLDADEDGLAGLACGGTDCDDGAAGARPGLTEGGASGGTCADGLDNDCDGRTDAQDNGCVVLSGDVCSPDGWCWSNPFPLGVKLRALEVFSATDVWAVGDAGTILRWNGSAWVREQSGVTAQLNDIFALGPTQMWIVGHAGTLLRRQGASWVSETTNVANDLYGFWASSATDLWAVGSTGQVVRSSGGGDWTAVGSGQASDLYAVWGFGEDAVWAVGAGGASRFWNGMAWSTRGNSDSFTLRRIWGTALDDVWIVGDTERIYHWTGSSFATPNDTTGLGLTVSGVWGAAGTLWAVGANGTLFRSSAGGPWQSIDTLRTDALTAVEGSGASDVWVVGDRGAILRYDGMTWSNVDSGHRNTNVDVHPFTDTEVWTVTAEGLAYRYDGASWSALTPFTSHPMRGLWGTSPRDVWIVTHTAGTGSLAWYPNDSSWLSLNLGTGGANQVAIWGLSTDAVYTIGGGSSSRWSGGSWGSTSVSPGYGCRGMHGMAGELWVACDSNHVGRWNGSGWTLTPQGTTSNWSAVHVVSASDIWWVGPNGAVMRYTGTYAMVPSWTTENLNGVWARAADDVYAVGDNGTIIHWDGDGWTPQDSGTRTHLSSIQASAGGDLWVVGPSGVVLRKP